MVYLKKCNLVIVLIYRAPNTPLSSFTQCINKAKSFCGKFNGVDLLILGDFNMRFLDWTTEIINKTGIPSSEQEQAELFLNFTQQLLLTQIVTENTRKDKSILDLILVTDPDMIHNVSIEKTTRSDHDIVRCSFVHNQLQIEKNLTEKTYQHKHQLDKLNFDRADWDSINKELAEIDWDEEFSEASVEKMYQTLEAHVTNICSNHTPERKRYTYINQISNERLRLIKKKKRLS